MLHKKRQISSPFWHRTILHIRSPRRRVQISLPASHRYRFSCAIVLYFRTFPFLLHFSTLTSESIFTDFLEYYLLEILVADYRAATSSQITSFWIAADISSLPTLVFRLVFMCSMKIRITSNYSKAHPTKLVIETQSL